MSGAVRHRGTLAGFVLLFAGCSGTSPSGRPPVSPPPASAPAPPALPPAPVGVPPPTASPNLELGAPSGGDSSEALVLDERAYVVSYDPKREIANWVAWRLDEHDLGDADRANNFRADDHLPSTVYHVTPGDYAHSGFDRGHLCPSADRTDTTEDNSVTFLMTNMHPQRPELNRVTWKALEEHERLLAKGHHELYIVAGGLFDPSPPTIGHGVAVPRAEYKIIVVLEAGQGAANVGTDTEVIAAIMPNDATVKQKPWTSYLTTVDEIERESGYDFLTRVPEDVQRVVEARVATIR